MAYTLQYRLTMPHYLRAEIFNMRCRAKGLGLTYGLNWAFSILVTYCMPLFMASTYVTL